MNRIISTQSSEPSLKLTASNSRFLDPADRSVQMCAQADRYPSSARLRSVVRPLESVSPPRVLLSPNRLSSKPAPNKGQALMRHEFILVIGPVAGGCLPGEAQAPARHIFLAQRSSRPMILFFDPSPPNRRSSIVSLAIDPTPNPVGSSRRVSTATYKPERRQESYFSIRAVRPTGHPRGLLSAEP